MGSLWLSYVVVMESPEEGGLQRDDDEHGVERRIAPRLEPRGRQEQRGADEHADEGAAARDQGLDAQEIARDELCDSYRIVR